MNVSECRHVFKMDSIAKEILGIAFPSALAVAADPIASLIDTAFIGHLGTFPCHNIMLAQKKKTHLNCNNHNKKVLFIIWSLKKSFRNQSLYERKK